MEEEEGGTHFEVGAHAGRNAQQTNTVQRGKVYSSPHASQHNLTRYISHPGGSRKPGVHSVPQTAV